MRAQSLYVNGKSWKADRVQLTSPSRFPAKCHTARITVESSDVLSNPLKSKVLVVEAEVPLSGSDIVRTLLLSLLLKESDLGSKESKRSKTVTVLGWRHSRLIHHHPLD